MLTNRMVNTLLFETKLPFASSCGSTWPHCNTIYCRWGRYIPRTSLAKMLHIYGDRQLDRVPTHSRKLREMAFPWKIREISGIYQECLKTTKSQGILTGLKLENYYFLLFLFLDLKLGNYSVFTFLLYLDLNLENYSIFRWLSARLQ